MGAVKGRSCGSGIFEMIGAGCGALFCADAADMRLVERANAAMARDNMREFMPQTLANALRCVQPYSTNNN